MVPAIDAGAYATLESIHSTVLATRSALEWQFGAVHYESVARLFGFDPSEDMMPRLIRCRPKGVAFVYADGVIIEQTWGQVFDNTDLDA